jgi:hypothetical protein
LAPIALHAQNTATTTPVGYFTYEAKTGGNIIVPSLVEADAYSGQITAASANSITLPENSIVAGAYNAGSQFPTHYVEITSSGNNQGVTIDITSNTTSTVTLATNISSLALAGNENIVIRKHVTIGSVMKVAEPSLSLYSDSITVIEPNGDNTTYYLIGPQQWSSDFATVDGSDRPIAPGNGFIFTTGADVPLAFSGTVKLTPTVVQINGGGVPNIVGPVNPLAGNSAPISTLGFQNMEPYSDSITAYPPGSLVTPLATYYADGAGNVTSDLATASNDVFFFTRGVILSSFSNSALRLNTGL